MNERRYTVYRSNGASRGERSGARRRDGGERGAAQAVSGAAAHSGAPIEEERRSGGSPPRQVYARPRRPWLTMLRYAGLVIVVAVCGIGGYWWGWLEASFAEMGKNNEVAVRKASKELAVATADQPVNILVLGSDRRDDIEGDKGRSDTMMLLRLDPNAGTISMLSVPRDLWVEIPGYGMERINVAYTLGGPERAIGMFKHLTGQPINHFVDVNFLGFIRVVGKLGGVYIDVDRRYYNPPGTGWAAIDLQPGYQLMTGRKALQFVRFRHDATGDFGRMRRQQVFLHEVERQAKRWQNFSKLPGLVKAITKNTVSDIDDLSTAISLAKMVLSLDTSQVYHSQIEGTPTMIDGKSVLLPSTQEINTAVNDYLDPQGAPVAQKISIPKDSYQVRVLNGCGTSGMATKVADALTGEGYVAVEGGNADAFDYTNSVVYATKGLQAAARSIAKLLRPANVQIVPTMPGTLGGISVIVGSQYGGQLSRPPSSATVVQAQVQQRVNQNAAEWRVWAGKSGVPLMMPSAWSPGMTWDVAQWHTYTIKTPDGQRAAFCAVGSTVAGGYWHVQATSWDDPPILSDPNEVRTIKGREYSLFYQNDRLHRVAWRQNGTVYWLANTLDDQISNKVMLELARSFKPVQ